MSGFPCSCREPFFQIKPDLAAEPSGRWPAFHLIAASIAMRRRSDASRALREIELDGKKAPT